MSLKFKNSVFFFCSIILINSTIVFSQTNPDDYYLNHGFTSGQTVTTNTGKFYDDGGYDKYAVGQNWTVKFCSENGNPITVDFSGFRTYNPPPHTNYANYDYMTINYPSNNYVAYDNDTPQFSFTSPNGCITFGLVSKPLSPRDSGWVAEISANPPPSNNDPCAAANLVVGNVCAPEYFSNKGAYNTTTWGSPTCHTFFGGGVWFKATVPASGQIKIQALPGTLTYAIMELFSSTSCNTLARITCVDNVNSMPTSILSGRTPGEVIYVRIFGDQAKSGTFGMCATDPTSPITGFTGPGGVGDSLSNELWLRADNGLLNSSDAVAVNTDNIKTWLDKSGNQNNLTQATAGNRPTLNTSGLNSLPTVVFDGTDDKFSKEIGSLSAPLMVFSVASFTGGSDNSLLSLGDANNNNTLSISKDASQKYYSYTLGSARLGPTLTLTTPYLFQAHHSTDLAYHRLKLGSISQTVSDYPSAVSTDGSFKLGTDRLGAGFFNGKVSEAIIYSKTLNSAQEVIVANYLGAKFGLALGANDKYAYDASHKNDVAGIGRVDANNIHTKAQSAGILAIGGANDLENGEYLMFGHDGGSISAWTSVNIPSSDPNVERLARTWKIDHSGGDGSVGQVSVSLDNTLLPALSAGYLAYNIFVDSDGDFTSGATAYGLIFTGTEYVANNVTLPDGCQIMIGIVKPYVSFSLANSSGFENIANPSITVSLNYAISSLCEVNYAVSGGTASGSGTDYFLNPGKVIFNPGQQTAIIQPLIIDDAIVEIPDEYFDITLSAPTASVLLGTQITHRHTIQNNDVGIAVNATPATIGTCAGSTSTLTATGSGTGPFNYAWSPVAGLTSPAASTTAAKPAATTYYKVTVTDANGYSNVDSVEITVVPALSKPSISVTGSLVFCSGDSVLLTSTAANSYLWSNGATTASIYAKTSGNYNVIAYDIYGCPSPTSDNTTVTVNALPVKPVLSPTGLQSVCAGDSLLVTAPLSTSYLWSTGATSQSIYIKTAGSYTVKVTNASGCQSISSDPVTLSVNALPSTPTISAGGPTTFCAGGSVTLTSSAGTSYLWSTGATTASINVTTAGSYTVQTANASGCQSAASAATVVTVNALPATPTITAGGSTTFCAGGSVTLTSSAGTSYLWSTGATTASINVTTSGSYSVQTTNASGCQSAASAATVVTVNALPATPTISAGSSTTFCAGGSVTLTSSAGTSYLWSTGATTASINVTTAGSYTVQTTNASGCQSAASAATVVTVNALPATPTITAGGSTTFCAGGSVTLTSSAGTSYLWSTGATTASINVTTSGGYTVQTTNASGCQSAASAATVVTVNALPATPTITAGSSTTFCAGGSVTLTSSAGTSYLWSTGATTASINVTTAGSYTVQTTNASGCQSAASAATVVTVNALPATPTISAGGSTTFCSGGSVTLTSSAGTSYLWSTGATTASINVTTAGSYTVQTTNASGCQSAASAATVVTVNALPATPTISVGGSTTFCSGGSVTLTSSAGTSYLWSTGATTASINVTTAGSYTVQTTNASGCQSAASAATVVTVNALPATPTITAGSSTTFCAGGSVTLTSSAGTSYLWSTGETTASINVTTSGSYTVQTTNASGCQSATSAATVVTVNALPATPTISAGGSTTFCSGGSVTLTSSAGTSYLWSTGATTASINVTTSGSYSVQTTNASGCQSAASAATVVTVNALPATPTISAGGSTTFCAGGSVTLTSSAGTSYLWSTGATTASINVTTAGSYTVQTTNASGCQSAASAATVVTVNALPATPTISAGGPTTFCAGGSVTLTSSAGTSYLWSTGATTASINVTTAGSYTVQITNASGCQSAASAATVVTVNALPATPTITAGGSTTFCAGGSVTLTSSAGTSYLWSTGETTASINVTTSGSYTVQTTNASGCQSAASAATVVTVNALPVTPTITAGGSTTFCAGGSVTLTSSAGASYLWSTGATTASINVTTSGSYTVQTTNASGCQSAASAATVVTVNALPATPTITAGGSTTFCAGGSVTLTSSAGTSYLWSTGATTASINVSTAGSYTVQTTNASGCQSAASAATIVTVNALPATPTITAGGSTTFCAGGSVTLTSSAGTSYLWSTGASTASINVTTAGSYTVQTTNASGCQSAASAAMVVTVNALPATPTISAGGSTTFCSGGSVTLTSSAGTSYLWSTGATTASINVTTSGSYTVQTTNASGCQSAASAATVVTVNALPATPTISAGGSTTFCSGGSVTLTSSAGTSYLWSTGETTASINATTAGSYTVQTTNASGCQSAASSATVVTVNALPATPSINADGPTTFCQGGNVTLTSSIGTTYLWSTGETSSSIIVSDEGSYSVQITDLNACLSNSSSIVTVSFETAPVQPTISTSGALSFCNGESVVLTSSNGNSYIWSNGELTESIEVFSSGIYTVKVTNLAGCESISSLPVEVIVNDVPAKPVVNASGATTFCEGENVILSTDLATGYLWSNGETSESITVSLAGSYSVIVTNEFNCSSIASDPITVNVNLIPSVPAISIIGATEFCEGGLVTLTAPVSDGYLWSDGQSTQSINVSNSGNYSLQIIDANLCQSQSSADVVVTVFPSPEKPIITADGPLTFLIGENVTLSSSIADTYLWSPGGESIQSILVTDPGIYSVTVTDNNGCTSEASDIVEVIVKTKLDKPVITLSGDTELCVGEQLTLSSAPAFAYLWSNGETTQSIQVSTAGVYSLIISNINGIESDASDPVSVNVNDNPIISISKTDASCFGSQDGAATVEVISSTGALNFVWSNGSNLQNLNGIGAGNYTVIATDINLCKDTKSATILQPSEIQIIATVTDAACPDAKDGAISITSSGGSGSYTYLWNTGNSTNSIDNLEVGDYSVEAKDANNCLVTESIVVGYIREQCFDIPGIITPNNDGYNDTWVIDGLELYPDNTVEIYDRYGKRVFYMKSYDNSWDGSFEGKELPMESYHYMINLNNGTSILKGNITIVR